MMFARLFGFFSGGSLAPWLLLGSAAALIGSFGAGAYVGHHYGWLQQEDAIASAAQSVIATTRQQTIASDQASQAFASQEAKTQTATQTIIQKVPVYVTKNANAHCPIPVGFVRLHDAAASGVPILPSPAGQSDATAASPDLPSGLSLSDVAGTVADNYGACHQIAQQLIDLQGWVSRQQSISAK